MTAPGRRPARPSRRLARALAGARAAALAGLVALPPAVSADVAAAGSLLSPVACAGAGCAEPAPEGAIEVADARALRAALEAARGGEVLRLAPGAYGTLELNGFAPDAPVTLRSADPADPARIEGMVLRGVSRLRFEGVAFDYRYEPGTRPTGARPFRILGGSEIEIRHATFDGDRASGTGNAADDGFAAGTGLFASGTEGLTIEGSLFAEWFRGAVLREVDDLVVSGNRIAGMRSDGLNLVAVQGALVEGNEIGPFRRSPASSDHADLIQFWTNKTDRPSRDVAIRGNLLHAGGGEATQSIFMRNEEVDRGRAGREMFYQDVRIEGNVIANGHLHGITVGEAEGLAIRRNTLVRVPSTVREGASRTLSTPGIRVAGRSRDVTVEGNVTGPVREGGPSGLVHGHEGQPGWRVEGNVLAQDERPDAPGWYGALFVAATGPERPVEGLRPHPDGPLADGRAGAPLLAPRAGEGFAPGELIPVIRVERAGAAANRFAFDAGLSEGPQGPLRATAGAAVAWRFPDGGAAEGMRAERALAPGRHAVEATLRLPDGTEGQARAVVEVPSPRVLDWRPEAPLALGEGTHRVGQEAIARWFGAADMALSLRFRAGGEGAAGQILRIHPGLVVSLGAMGNLEVALRTAEREAVRVRTAPLRLHDGAWHEARIAYDSRSGRLEVQVDGALRAEGRSAGRLPPRENWGLMLGHADPARSFRGEVAWLAIDADEGAFAPAGG